MANPSLIPALITLVDRSANDPAQVNTNFTRVRTAMNDAFSEATGHNHDGSNSALISVGLGSLNPSETMIALMMKTFW